MSNEALKALAEIAQPPTYLHIENQQLKQQLAQMQQALNPRFSQAVMDFLNGVMIFVNLAQNGDPGAQQIVRTLSEALDKVREQSSPITVIHAA